MKNITEESLRSIPIYLTYTKHPNAFKLNLWFQFYELHFNTMSSHCFLPGDAIQVRSLFSCTETPQFSTYIPWRTSRQGKNFLQLTRLLGRGRSSNDRYHINKCEMMRIFFFCSSLKTNYIGQLKKKKKKVLTQSKLHQERKQSKKNELDRAWSSVIYCRAIKKIYQLFVMLQETKHKRQNPGFHLYRKKNRT